MNAAIFIDRESTADNEALALVERIRIAQEEIYDAVRDLEITVGQVEFVKEADIHKLVLVVDEKILDECCEKAISNIHLVKETYRQLFEMGVLKKKSRESRL